MEANPNTSELLCNEILAQARNEGERILRRARQDAESLAERAAADAENVRRVRLEEARSEAGRRKALILATVSVEAGRLRLARIEALLESVREEVRRRLIARAGFDYHQTLVSLAAEAIKQMRGDAFVVTLPSTDDPMIADRLGEEIARRVARAPLDIIISSGLSADCGLIVEDSETRQFWDDRLPDRLDRLWPELRRRIAVGTSLLTEGNPGGGIA